MNNKNTKRQMNYTERQRRANCTSRVSHILHNVKPWDAQWLSKATRAYQAVSYREPSANSITSFVFLWHKKFCGFRLYMWTRSTSATQKTVAQLQALLHGRGHKL